MTGHIIEARDGDTAILTISHRHKLNALTVGMWQQLRERFEALSQEDVLRCVVIRGAGEEAFSSGADISEFATQRCSYDQVVRFHETYVLGALDMVASCPVPVIAAIRGACFGGGLEIATVCDLRLAADDARFGAPVGRLGFPLALGETQALFRLVGPATAAELLLEGRTYDAATACAKGLVTRVVPCDRFEAALAETVANILKSGPLAARSHKSQLRRLARDPAPVSREERMAGYAFAESPEYREGLRAFLERRSR